MTLFEKETLMEVLQRALGAQVDDVEWTVETLQGGDVGDVYRVAGLAQTQAGALPYSVVLKVQKQWNRPGDPGSWRREYELYAAGAYDALPEGLHVPTCYRLEAEDAVTRIWMEDVQGLTGGQNLGSPEHAKAARQLATYQKALVGQPLPACLRPFPAVESSFAFWWGRMEKFLREGIDGIDPDVQQALVRWGDQGKEVLSGLSARLPRTLCHGDAYHDNIFLMPDGRVCLIDWDTAGIGYLGEDSVDMVMECFAYADQPTDGFEAFWQEVTCAYRATAGGPQDTDLLEIAMLAWGYRIADMAFYYLKEGKDAQKDRCVEVLKALVQMAGER